MCVYRGIWFLHFYCLPHLVLRRNELDFHGGPAVRESACQSKGHGFNPWSGRSHVPWGNKADDATTTGPAQEKPSWWEACVCRSWKGAPLSAPGESRAHSNEPSAAKKQFFQKRWKRPFPSGSLTAWSMSPGLSNCLINLCEWRGMNLPQQCVYGWSMWKLNK